MGDGFVPSAAPGARLAGFVQTGDDRRVRFLFLDESGKIEDGRLFALGGIAVRDTDWAPLRDLWPGTLRGAGWPLDREVKWHGIRGPSHHSIGLQCADLIVAATAAAERGGGDARRYLAKLLPRFAHHPATGELEGVGLKAVPRPHGEGRLFGLEGIRPPAGVDQQDVESS